MWKSKKYLEKCWVIKFQKRGLSHTHISLILDEQSKLRTTEQINSVVIAKSPNSTNHPNAYEIVTRCFVHNSYRTFNRKSSSIENKKCNKQYPWNVVGVTCANSNGYPLYRKRDDGRTFIKRIYHHIDNRWIVLYNLYLVDIVPL